MTIEEWAKDFKSFVNELQIPRDDYKGIMSYIDDALALLKEQETVIRCKDCKNNNQCSIQFKFANADNPGDWYCADGKASNLKDRTLQKEVIGVKLNPDRTWTAITKDDYDPILD